jgi:hypothetical protein
MLSFQIVFVTGSDLADQEATFQQNSRNESLKRYPPYTRLDRLPDHPARTECTSYAIPAHAPTDKVTTKVVS